MIEILYDDRHICICKKMPGMLSEEADSDDSLPNLLKAQLGCEIFVLHRLDKPVGGAIMYAKTKAASSAFSRLIQENDLQKEYLAVLDKIPDEESAMLTDLLFRDKQKNKTFVVRRMRKGVKEAKLDYRVVMTQDNHALVNIRLHTGRTHQIRAQFASRKMPLTGDGKYGSRDNGCEVALWSHSLTFNHPFTKETVSIQCEPPFGNYPWNLFQNKK